MVGTLDTKGDELRYVRDLLRARDIRTVLVDIATRNAKSDADISSETDAVLVTASSPAHASAVRAALLNGYHVLVEKPFTVDLDDAESLVVLARERDRILMVNQNYRFFPGPQNRAEISYDRRAWIGPSSCRSVLV